MRPYVKLGDETVVCYSEIRKQDGKEYLTVYFERLSKNGFDTAKCVIQNFAWSDVEGFEYELNEFEDFICSNLQFIFRLSRAELGEPKDEEHPGPDTGGI